MFKDEIAEKEAEYDDPLIQKMNSDMEAFQLL